jgi:hypothetical protein
VFPFLESSWPIWMADFQTTFYIISEWQRPAGQLFRSGESGRRLRPHSRRHAALRGDTEGSRGVSDHEIWPLWRSSPRPQPRSLTPRWRDVIVASAGCSLGHNPLRSWRHFRTLTRVGFSESRPRDFSSHSETAGAARGAATKGGGWRSSGTLSCQPKRCAIPGEIARRSGADRASDRVT